MPFEAGGGDKQRCRLRPGPTGTQGSGYSLSPAGQGRLRSRLVVLTPDVVPSRHYAREQAPAWTAPTRRSRRTTRTTVGLGRGRLSHALSLRGGGTGRKEWLLALPPAANKSASET